MKIRLGGVMAGRAAEKLGINITTVAASELFMSPCSAALSTAASSPRRARMIR